MPASKKGKKKGAKPAQKKTQAKRKSVLNSSLLSKSREESFQEEGSEKLCAAFDKCVDKAIEVGRADQNDISQLIFFMERQYTDFRKILIVFCLKFFSWDPKDDFADRMLKFLEQFFQRCNLPLLDEKNLTDRVVDEIMHEPMIGKKKKLKRDDIIQMPDFQERCQDVKDATEELKDKLQDLISTMLRECFLFYMKIPYNAVGPNGQFKFRVSQVIQLIFQQFWVDRDLSDQEKAHNKKEREEPFQLDENRETHKNFSKIATELISSSKATLQEIGLDLAFGLDLDWKKLDNADTHQAQFKALNLMANGKSNKTRIRVIKELPEVNENTLPHLALRLRDAETSIRQATYEKILASGVKLQDFPDAEGRMLLLIEGLREDNKELAQVVRMLINSSIGKIQPSEDSQPLPNLEEAYSFINQDVLFIKNYLGKLPHLFTEKLFDILGANAMRDYALYTIQAIKQIDSNRQWRPKSSMLYATRSIFVFLKRMIESKGEIDEAELKVYSEIKSDLEDAMPNYEDYLKIFDCLCGTKSQANYDLFDNPTDTEIYELQRLQVKENRTCLAEWLRLTDFMNTDEEVTKSMLINKISEFITSIAHSYNDYVHLLEPKRFLLDDRTGEPIVGINYRQIDPAVSSVDLFDEKEGTIGVDIQIRSFTGLLNKKVEEYAKDHAREEIIRDSDDCCSIAVNVLARLMSDQKQEFADTLFRAINDAAELVIPQQSQLQQQDMYFMSQLAEPEDKKIPLHHQKEIFYDQINQLCEKMNDELEEIDSDDQQRRDRKLQKVHKELDKKVAYAEEVIMKYKLNCKKALTLTIAFFRNYKTKKGSQVVNDLIEYVINEILNPKDRNGEPLKVVDHEIALLCFQAIGLTTMIEQERYEGTIAIFKNVLQDESELTDFKVKEKIIIMKASCDTLVAYHLCSKSEEIFQMFYKNFQYSPHPAIRSLAVESLCKMMLSYHLANNLDDLNPDMRAHMLAQLMIQFYDDDYTWSKESETKQILSAFFKNIVLLNTQQHEIVFRSLNMLIFAIIESKVKKEETVAEIKGTLKGSKLRVKAAEMKKQAKKKKRPALGESESESETEAQFSDASEDSNYDDMKMLTLEVIIKNFKYPKVVKLLDLFSTFLSNEYLAFQEEVLALATRNYGLYIMLQVAVYNELHFKQPQIVKDILQHMTTFNKVDKEKDLGLLLLLQQYLEKNLDYVPEGSIKINSFLSQIDERLEVIKKEKEKDFELESEHGFEDRDLEEKWELYKENEESRSIEIIGEIEEDIQKSIDFYHKIICNLVIGPSLREVTKVKEERVDIIPLTVAEQKMKLKTISNLTPNKLSRTSKFSEESIEESSESQSHFTKSVHKKMSKAFIDGRRNINANLDLSIIPSEQSPGVETMEEPDKTVLKMTRHKREAAGDTSLKQISKETLPKKNITFENLDDSLSDIENQGDKTNLTAIVNKGKQSTKSQKPKGSRAASREEEEALRGSEKVQKMEVAQSERNQKKKVGKRK